MTGFSTESFAFLRELGENNNRDGAVRLMRTRIRLLGQPEPMRSIVGATQ